MMGIYFDNSDRRCRREIFVFIFSSLFCFLGLVFLYFFHPSFCEFMPRCPFYFLTGMYCPGCGSTRAIHYCLNGNISESVRHHPLLLPFFVVIIFLYIKRGYELFSGKIISFRFELLMSKIILFIFIIFFVVRNIPIDYWAWLRPPAVMLPWSIDKGNWKCFVKNAVTFYKIKIIAQRAVILFTIWSRKQKRKMQ